MTMPLRPRGLPSMNPRIPTPGDTGGQAPSPLMRILAGLAARSGQVGAGSPGTPAQGVPGAGGDVRQQLMRLAQARMAKGGGGGIPTPVPGSSAGGIGPGPTPMPGGPAIGPERPGPTPIPGVIPGPGPAPGMGGGMARAPRLPVPPYARPAARPPYIMGGQ